MIEIRIAVLEDLPILYRFEQGIIEIERPFDPTLKDEKINYYDLWELILAENAEVFVAVSDQQIIGSGYVKILKASDYQKYDSYAYVGFMFVEPQFRGKGVSQKLLVEFNAWAKSKGLEEIRLKVYEQNSRAINAYEKSGYKKHVIEMRMPL